MSTPTVSDLAIGVKARTAWRFVSAIRRSGVRVLSTIAELDAAGGCFASMGWIASRCGVHRNTVRHWIRVAQRSGVLLVVPQRTARGAQRSSLLVPCAPLSPSEADLLRAWEHRERCEAAWTPKGPLRDETLKHVKNVARSGRQAPKAQDQGLGVQVASPRCVFGAFAFDFPDPEPGPARSEPPKTPSRAGRVLGELAERLADHRFARLLTWDGVEDPIPF